MDIFYDQSYNLVMRQIAAARFKAECLALLDEVDQEGIVITKHGKPVARLTSMRADSAGLIGSLKSKVRITGKILSTGAGWDAQS